MSELKEPQKSGVSRRTVTKAMAWSVPAIAVAATVPNAAASPRCLTASFSGNSCKQPGANAPFGYRLEICFTNVCNIAITLTVTQVQANTGQAPVQAVNQTITIQPNQTACLPNFVNYCSTSSANFITVSYYIGNASGTILTQNVASPPQECQNVPSFCA